MVSHLAGDASAGHGDGAAAASSDKLSSDKLSSDKSASGKASSGKAQHRWLKALSGTPFHIDYHGASGTVIWQRPTEMRLLKGAKMQPDSDAPRRADGTLGFTAKFALGLRAENAAHYDHNKWVTTDDIILRSVNEVGHFLYFAGTNSWLVLHDDAGRTIDEYARY